MSQISSIRAQEQVIISSLLLMTTHNTIVMQIRKIILRHFPYPMYSLLIERVVPHGTNLPVKSYCWHHFNACMLQRLSMGFWQSIWNRKHYVLNTLPSTNHCYNFSRLMLSTCEILQRCSFSCPLEQQSFGKLSKDSLFLHF